jgi:hypothetical protein
MARRRLAVVVVAGVVLCAINVPSFYWISGGHSGLITTLLVLGVVTLDLVIIRFLIYHLSRD